MRRRFSVNVQLTEKDNPAVGILMVGFLLGVTAIVCGVFYGDSAASPSVEVFLDEIVPVLIYGGIGIVLLFLSGIVKRQDHPA